MALSCMSVALVQYHILHQLDHFSIFNSSHLCLAHISLLERCSFFQLPFTYPLLKIHSLLQLSYIHTNHLGNYKHSSISRFPAIMHFLRHVLDIRIVDFSKGFPYFLTFSPAKWWYKVYYYFVEQEVCDLSKRPDDSIVDGYRRECFVDDIG
jgi:hypothetical protein